MSKPKKVVKPKAKKAKAYLVFQFYDRFDGPKTIRKTFDRSLIDEAYAMAIAKDELAQEAFIEDLQDRDYDLADVLYSFMNDGKNFMPKGQKLLKQWKDKKRVAGSEEEFLFGIGTTKDQARIAFADAIAEFGDDEDDEDWGD